MLLVCLLHLRTLVRGFYTSLNVPILSIYPPPFPVENRDYPSPRKFLRRLKCDLPGLVNGFITRHFSGIITLKDPIDSTSLATKLHTFRIAFIHWSLGPRWSAFPITGAAGKPRNLYDLAIDIFTFVIQVLTRFQIFSSFPAGPGF